MPIAAGALTTIQSGIAVSLKDWLFRQAILNVRVTRGATAVRLRFDTVWPCFATVEIFRMVHGELSLDMEKENLVQTEVELFGNARTRHDVTLGGLEQERRFWFRISVPRKSPAETNATGKVRLRGELATKRRNTTVVIERIHIFDDSDTSGAGELRFASAIYDATFPKGPRITEPVFAGEFDRSSGQDIEAPFGDPVGIGRAPDVLGIMVTGQDDDSDAFDIFSAPWEGLGLIGMHPPDQMPDEISASSTHSRDYSSAAGSFVLPRFSARSTSPFSFPSVQGALHYEVQVRFFTNIFDTLPQRIVPPWKVILLTRMRLARDERPAGLMALQDGRLALALSDEGRLRRREDRPQAAWEELEGPPLEQVLVQFTRDGRQVLAGIDGDGRLHVAGPTDLQQAALRWQAVEPPIADLPVTVEDLEGGAHVLATDRSGGLWHLHVTAAGDPAAPRQIAEGAADRTVAAIDSGGRMLAVFGSGDAGLRLVVLDRAGDLVARDDLAGPFATPLAIVEDETEGLLVVAADQEEQVAVFRPAAPEAGWETIGLLDDVLEGPPGTVPIEEGKAQAA